MSTGAAHYKLAEEILDEAKRFMTEALAEAVDSAEILEILANHAGVVAQAQAHATLALAAATALQTPSGEDGGMYVRDAEEWERACSLVAPEQTP